MRTSSPTLLPRHGLLTRSRFPPVQVVPWPVERLRSFFRSLEDPALAALLRELAWTLWEREFKAWRSLVDVSDDLIDRTFEAPRTAMAEAWLAGLTQNGRKPLAHVPVSVYDRGHRETLRTKRKSRRRP